MKKNTYIYGKFLIIAAIVVTADMITKNFAAAYLRLPSWIIEGKIGFLYAENYGIAFSIPISGVILLTTNLIILGLLFYFAHGSLKNYDRILLWSFSLLIGGAVGNLFDRLTRGYVVDFIALGRFPVFNIADMALTVGAVLLAIRTLKQKNYESS